MRDLREFKLNHWEYLFSRDIQILNEKLIFLTSILALLKHAITRLDNRQTGMNMNIYCIVPYKNFQKL